MSYIEYTVKVTAEGDKDWYLDGKRHREDGPAIENADGSEKWFLNGELHRVDGPAVKHTNGDEHWYLNDEKHREGGPACEFDDGSKLWYLHGKRVSQLEAEGKSNCEGKVVTFEGKQYKLTEV